MAIKPLDLSGGKSVYCFNESQIQKAFELAQSETESGEKIRNLLKQIIQDTTRNERAALAFMVIDELNKTSPE